MVWACTPSVALTTTIARSVTASAMASSEEKSAYPGTSRTLTLIPSSSNGAMARDTDSWRWVSSGSKSQTVVPFSTEPSRGMVPVTANRASARAVLPAPWWPIKHTLWIDDGDFATASLPWYLVRVWLPRAGRAGSRVLSGRA